MVFWGNALAQDDAAVDPRYTWDLTDLYPSVEAWDAARQEVMENYEKIEARKGTLGNSADDLYQTYRLVSDTMKEAGRVFVYASMQNDEDQRDPATQERRRRQSTRSSAADQTDMARLSPAPHCR